MKWKLTTYRMLALTAVVLVAADTTMAIGTPRGVFEPTFGTRLAMQPNLAARDHLFTQRKTRLSPAAAPLCGS
ncbi:hypothetical protein ACVWXL_009029 [Bradyrhizobium sp. GM22.5]